MRKVILDEMAELHKKFMELRTYGLQCVFEDEVSIGLKEFLGAFDEYEVSKFDLEGSIYAYKVSAYHNGVKFLALFSPKEAEQYGIQIQEQDI